MLRFLKQIDRETPKQLELHLIIDNYGTHKHEKVREWLGRRPDSTCTSRRPVRPGSTWWKRFFGELTQDVLRDGSFTSVGELVSDIESYLIERNRNPKPYQWKAKGVDILRKIQRARQALDGRRGGNS